MFSRLYMYVMKLIIVLGCRRILVAFTEKSSSFQIRFLLVDRVQVLFGVRFSLVGRVQVSFGVRFSLAGRVQVSFGVRFSLADGVRVFGEGFCWQIRFLFIRLRVSSGKCFSFLFVQIRFSLLFVRIVFNLLIVIMSLLIVWFCIGFKNKNK